MDQICSKKGVLGLKQKKWTQPLNSAYSISPGTKFQLKVTILIFWTKFAQRGCFWSKTEKMKSTIEFCIFELVWVPNFSLSWQFWFLGPRFPKRVIPVKNIKSEHHHWILHIQISGGTKFQFKLTILIFFYQICSKKEFPVENGKIALVRASMIVTYYIKLFRTGANRHNGILMSLLFLVAETIITFF